MIRTADQQRRLRPDRLRRRELERPFSARIAYFPHNSLRPRSQAAELRTVAPVIDRASPGRARRSLPRPSTPRHARLEPTPTARHYVAKALLATGQPAADLWAAGELEGRGDLCRLRSFALQTRGEAWSALERPQAASAAFEAAAEDSEFRPAPTAFWLCNALLALDEEAARRAIELLNEAPGAAPVIRRIVDLIEALRTRRDWEPHEAVRRLARRLVERANESPRRILDALD